MYKYIYRFLALLFVLFSTTNLFAQREFPGGVDNVQVWLKSDNSIIPETNSPKLAKEWRNSPSATERSVKFTVTDVAGGAQNPIIERASYKMNFNDALSFSAGQFLASKVGISGAQNVVTVFAVYIAEKGQSDVRMYYTGFGSTNPTAGSTRDPSIGFTPNPDKTGGRVRLSASRDGNGGYSTNTTALQMTLVPETVVSPYVIFRFNGKDFSTDVNGNQLTGAGKGALNLVKGITLGGASLGSGKFYGQLGEYIAYNRVLTTSEISHIESYLGTKFGITLDGAAYVSSTGTVFWTKGNTGVGYHNNVAGIFTDSGNDNITVSRSTAAGAALTVSTIGTKFEVGVGVTNEVPLPVDDSSIYWGTNIGQGYTSKPAKSPGCGYSEILEGKYWKFKKTNLGSTTVEVRAGGDVFPYKGELYQVKMLVAKTEADAKADKWLAVIPGTYVGGDLEEHLFRLPIDRDEIYITFAANAGAAQCIPCTTSATGVFKFSSSKWANGAKSASDLTASNGVKFDVTYKTYSNNKEEPSMQMAGYPRVSNGNLLESRFRGLPNSDNNYATTNITFKEGATFSKFKIYGIDKNSTTTDMIEVIGYCGNTTYNGIVSSSSSDKDKSFTVGNGSVISGMKPSSITNKNSVATIEFPHEVTRIEIKHKVHYRSKTRGYQNIAIGDFELNCPRPASPNPDGIEFTLQAPPKVVSCGDFTYTFKVWNYACEARYVNIEDELPEGMYWVKGGVSSTESVLSEAVINEYGNTKKLIINKVKLAAGTYTTVTARVRFKDDAVPGIFENRGKLTYTSMNKDNKVVTIESCDYNTFDSCVPTKVEMTYQARVLSPVVTIDPITKRCYKDKGILTIKAKVKNPNPAIDFTNLSIALTYNEDFNFISFKPIPGQGTVLKDEGIHIVNGLNITGGSTLELIYEVQALDFLALIKAVTGNTYTKPRDVPDADIAKVLDFGAQIEVVGNSEDECINASLEDVYAVLDPTLPFCGRDLSCYYPPKLGQVVKKNSDFVMMTSLDRSKAGSLATENINAILYLESKSKGFVPTRMTEIQVNALVSPVAGMLVYDTTNKCLKLYNGVLWACLVQTCPDN